MAKTNIRAASGPQAVFFPALPPRRFRPMPPQPLVPWTLARMARAALAWLMEEQQLEYRR